MRGVSAVDSGISGTIGCSGRNDSASRIDDKFRIGHHCRSNGQENNNGNCPFHPKQRWKLFIF